MISAPISRVGNNPPGFSTSTAIIASASTISVRPITGSPDQLGLVEHALDSAQALIGDGDDEGADHGAGHRVGAADDQHRKDDERFPSR